MSTKITMNAKTIMFMGTGSDVGKSLIVAGLCRALKNRNIKIAPFKPQNMSNNASVCENGGEIGRAQALQALAAGLEPNTNMNPILLKPEHDSKAQLIIRGERIASMSAKKYFSTREKYMPQVLESFEELKQDYDYVLVEGAGSASEVNLRHNDLANFGFAQSANVPVVLIGDISRGGVIASIIGTLEVIDKKDRELIVGSIINKFQGDKSLFADGLKIIERYTKQPTLGLVPFFPKANKLPAEDVLALEKKVTNKQVGLLHIAILKLSRIANFDDFDPLIAEENIFVDMIDTGRSIPQNADLIIIPGSKATISDMKFILEQGWDIDIKAHVRANKPVLGICGGYQILGKVISDPLGIEGEAQNIEGLGLLNISTRLTRQKQLENITAIDAVFGQEINAYHMHLGVSEGEDCQRPFALNNNESEGAISGNGLISGTYLHGIFANDGFRQNFLSHLGAKAKKTLNYQAQVEQVLDELAAHLEANLDIDKILELAR